MEIEEKKTYCGALPYILCCYYYSYTATDVQSHERESPEGTHLLFDDDDEDEDDNIDDAEYNYEDLMLLEPVDQGQKDVCHQNDHNQKDVSHQPNQGEKNVFIRQSSQGHINAWHQPRHKVSDPLSGIEKEKRFNHKQDLGETQSKGHESLEQDNSTYEHDTKSFTILDQSENGVVNDLDPNSHEASNHSDEHTSCKVEPTDNESRAIKMSPDTYKRSKCRPHQLTNDKDAFQRLNCRSLKPTNEMKGTEERYIEQLVEKASSSLKLILKDISSKEVVVELEDAMVKQPFIILETPDDAVDEVAEETAGEGEEKTGNVARKSTRIKNNHTSSARGRKHRRKKGGRVRTRHEDDIVDENGDVNDLVNNHDEDVENNIDDKSTNDNKDENIDENGQEMDQEKNEEESKLERKCKKSSTQTQAQRQKRKKVDEDEDDGDPVFQLSSQEEEDESSTDDQSDLDEKTEHRPTKVKVYTLISTL